MLKHRTDESMGQKNGRHEVDRFKLTTTWTTASKSPIHLA